MKKILMINGSDYGSTGSISFNIIDYVIKSNEYDFALFVSNKKNHSPVSIKFTTNKFVNLINKISTKVDGGDGFKNYFDTKKLIKKIKIYNPDLIHLHSVHGHYINIEMLIKYANLKKIPIVWTLHDNWIATGRCAVIPDTCSQLLNKCKVCKFKQIYPRTVFDFANKYYSKKEKLLQNVNNMIFVSPSIWNKNIVQQTILKEKDVIVINNGIDLNIFKPTESNLRDVLNIQNKFVILCAAYPWSNSKGLAIINEISSRLDERFKIVMLGLTKNIETNSKILRFDRIKSAQEMAKYYSMADVFLTPTLGDNFPTVDMESLACGTPVISFDVGGTKEIVADNVGWVVKKGDIDTLEKCIYEAYESPISKSTCCNYAKRFDRDIMCQKYLDLYNKMIEGTKKKQL